VGVKSILKVAAQLDEKSQLSEHCGPDADIEWMGHEEDEETGSSVALDMGSSEAEDIGRSELEDISLELLITMTDEERGLCGLFGLLSLFGL
jgi:hypothetical protein